jgi:hypothetical protein
MTRVLKSKLKHVVGSFEARKIRDAVERCHQVVEVAYAFTKLELTDRYEKALKANNGQFGQNAAKQFANGLSLDSELFDDMLSVASGSGREKKQGRGYSEDRKKRMDAYNAKYQEWAKDGVLPAEKPISANLSFALDYEKTSMATAYKNNVFRNFERYVKAFVRHHLVKENPNDPRPSSSLVARLTNMVLGVRDGGRSITSGQQDMVARLRPLAVPTDLCDTATENNQPWRYRCKTTPQRFLPHMIYMSRVLEDAGLKVYSPLPIRSSFVPSYVTLDTQGLLDILLQDADDVDHLKADLSFTVIPGQEKSRLYFELPGLKGKGDFVKSLDKILAPKQKDMVTPGVFRTVLWSLLTKIPSKHAPMEYQECVFANMIETDGYGVSIHYCAPDRVGTSRFTPGVLQKAAAEKRAKKEEAMSSSGCDSDGFAYAHKMSQQARADLLEQFEAGVYNPVSGDPGKGNILTLRGKGVDGSIHVLKYTRVQRNHESGFKKRKQRREELLTRRPKGSDSSGQTYENMQRSLGGDEQEGSRKSTNVDRFKAYLRARWNAAAGGVLRALYTGANMFRIHRYSAFLGMKSTQDKLVSRIKKVFGDNAFILWGDWGRNPNLRHQPPTPGIGLRRYVHKQIPTVSVSERMTSSVCPRCSGRNLTHPISRQHTNRRSGQIVSRPVHHLFCCQGVDCVWWNRDVLGACNIMKQGLHCLRYGRTDPCFDLHPH